MSLISDAKIQEAARDALNTKGGSADKAAKIRLAKQMLQSSGSLSFIRQVTGLHESEIEKLR